MRAPVEKMRPPVGDGRQGGTRGRDVFYDYLEANAVPYVFGNPGSTELPLVDGCNDHPSIRYVLALHEDIAVAQATGYARASGRVGVVNLHVTPGVAHGLGNIYNAFRARVPLLVTAGQHHAGLLVQEPILTADLAALTRPFTKWSYEVTRLDEMPIALHRAFKELTTPPYGPVFLSFTTDVFLETCADRPPVEVSRLAPVMANPAEIERAAVALAGAANPMIVAGDGVGLASAWDELVAIAEAIGAPVQTEGYATLWNFPADHPQYVGVMPNQVTGARAAFDDVDLVLMCGVTCQVPLSRYDGNGPLVPWNVRAVWVDDSPWEMGKNQPVEVGLLGDIRQNLQALAAALRANGRGDGAVAETAGAARAASTARRERIQEAVVAARSAAGITPTLVAAELREVSPADAVYVDEAVSNRMAFVDVLAFDDAVSFFSANGISLGYSTAAAVGVQMALPDRRVVNVVGDGSLMYYPQALWSVAAAGAPVLVIVLDNGSYRVLELIVGRLGGPWSADGQKTPGLTFREPPIDFVGLARSMGMAAERVATPAELKPALERGLGAGGPYLLHVVVDQG